MQGRPARRGLIADLKTRDLLDDTLVVVGRIRARRGGQDLSGTAQIRRMAANISPKVLRHFWLGAVSGQFQPDR